MDNNTCSGLDLELLNVFITQFHMSILSDTLWIDLKAHSSDNSRMYTIKVSEDKAAILKFFGYDTTIEYDWLSKRNSFVYLCSSPILQKYILPCDNQYNTKKVQKFVEYIEETYNAKTKCATQAKHCFINDAIEHFGLQEQYRAYKESYITLTETITMRKSIGMCSEDFMKMIKIHGLVNVSKWTREQLQDEYAIMKSQNWSGLWSLR